MHKKYISLDLRYQLQFLGLSEINFEATYDRYIFIAGLKKCGIGGAVGLGLASIYCLWTARDRLQGFRQEYNPA
jgi:hypothetical protein